MSLGNLTKTPGDGTCLGEPPGAFCDVGCWCCFYLTGGFYVSGLLFLATGPPPWLVRPVKATTSSVLYPGYFRFLYFLLGFYCEGYSLEWAFFTHRRFFYLAFFPIFFGTFLWLRCAQEHPIQDPPLCLPSQSCPFRLTHGLELLIL